MIFDMRMNKSDRIFILVSFCFNYTQSGVCSQFVCSYLNISVHLHHALPVSEEGEP